MTSKRFTEEKNRRDLSTTKKYRALTRTGGTAVADPGFVERGAWYPPSRDECWTRVMYPSRAKRGSFQQLRTIRDQWIMDAIREMDIAFGSVQCIRNNDEAMN